MYPWTLTEPAASIGWLVVWLLTANGEFPFNVFAKSWWGQVIVEVGVCKFWAPECVIFG